MNNGKKVLVLGGTGAMGVYLVPELVSMGYTVDVVSLDDVSPQDKRLKYIKANAKDEAFIKKLLENRYDAIVDFMIYGTEEFKRRYDLFLSNTGHYIYFSSYRVYADSHGPITESSPRLLDVSEDKEYLASDDYSLFKARGEDILQNSKYNNWTAVRPAITYSKRRFQLVTLEANIVVYRAMNKKTVVLPKEAMTVQSTMTWAGDVAKMLAHLVLNDKALRERYTLATAEHNPWSVVAGYYEEILGMKYVTTDKETYINILSGGASEKGAYNGCKWQLEYDRLFDRAVDNTKILAVTGLSQTNFTTLKDGLRRELSALPVDVVWGKIAANDRMDEFLKKI